MPNFLIVIVVIYLLVVCLMLVARLRSSGSDSETAFYIYRALISIGLFIIITILSLT